MSLEDVEQVQQCVSMDPREWKGRHEGLKADLWPWG